MWVVSELYVCSMQSLSAQPLEAHPASLNGFFWLRDFFLSAVASCCSKAICLVPLSNSIRSLSLDLAA